MKTSYLCAFDHQQEVTAIYENLSERAKAHMKIMSLSTSRNGLICVNDEGVIIFADADAYQHLEHDTLVGMEFFGETLCVPDIEAARSRQISSQNYCASLEEHMIRLMRCDPEAKSTHSCYIKAKNGSVDQYYLVMYSEAEKIPSSQPLGVEIGEMFGITEFWHRWCFIVLIKVKESKGFNPALFKAFNSSVNEFNYVPSKNKWYESILFQFWLGVWKQDKRLALMLPVILGLLLATIINSEWTNEIVSRFIEIYEKLPL